jgi:hypothetical protein
MGCPYISNFSVFPSQENCRRVTLPNQTVAGFFLKIMCCSLFTSNQNRVGFYQCSRSVNFFTDAGPDPQNCLLSLADPDLVRPSVIFNKHNFFKTPQYKIFFHKSNTVKSTGDQREKTGIHKTSDYRNVTT